MFYSTAWNKFNHFTASSSIWSNITVNVTYNTISACQPRCRVIGLSVYDLLTYNITHNFNKPPFFCFILQHQISLTVLQCLNHFEASWQSSWPTLPSLPVGRDAVLYVRLYMFCWHILSHIFSKFPRLNLHYFTE